MNKKNFHQENVEEPFRYVLPHIKEANNYVPPVFEKEVCGLYMNYSLYGPSPKCMEVLQNIDRKCFLAYPYGGNSLINKAIADHLKINEDMILADHGAANVLNQIFRVVLGKGDNVLIPNPGWDYYKSAANLLGAVWNQYTVFAKDDRYIFCEDEILKRLKETGAKLLIITSPNMPTGNSITQKQLEYISDNAKNVLILVDEAYYGYTRKYAMDIHYLIGNYPNLIFVRTLSKLYGLASERIGFAFCNKKLMNIIRKVAPLFGISYLSQLLGKTALTDVEYYENVSAKTIRSRERLADELTKLGSYQVYKSEANLLLIRLLKHSAEEVVKYFFNNGFAIRDCSRGYNLKSHIRISIGTEEITENVIKLFKEYEEIISSSNRNIANKGIMVNDTGDFKF